MSAFLPRPSPTPHALKRQLDVFGLAAGVAVVATRRQLFAKVGGEGNMAAALALAVVGHGLQAVVCAARWGLRKRKAEHDLSRFDVLPPPLTSELLLPPAAAMRASFSERCLFSRKVKRLKSSHE